MSETSTESLQFAYTDIEPITTEELAQLLNSLTNQYKRCIDFEKIAVGHESRKLVVNNIKTSSLYIDVVPFALGALELMQNTETVVTISKYFFNISNYLKGLSQVLPYALTKTDAKDLRDIFSLAGNISDKKTVSLNTVHGNQYNSCSFTISPSEMPQIEASLNKIEQINGETGSTANQDLAEAEKEYGESKKIDGQLVQINWSTNRGIIRTQIEESRRAKQYEFKIMDISNRPDHITPQTHITAKAVPVFKGSSNKIIELELTGISSYEP